MVLTYLQKLCRLIRYDILASTTQAGSGHPTSSLSAVELMATLFFGGFYHYDLDHPENIYNDRVIFSKGHAAPLLYSLYTVAGIVTQRELMSLRKFSSILQGHPTPDLPFVDVATGSLGQGLSVGLGMALGIRLKIKHGELKMKREPTVWILMGDSEAAEGQVWEAIEIASKYKLNNLVGIIDINRLGQSGETELSWDIRSYEERIKSFGWDTIVIKNGHNLEEINKAFEQANSLNTLERQKPLMILARTVKGKGVSFLEDKENLHGKVVPKDMLPKALKELGKVNLKLVGKIKKPETSGYHPDGSQGPVCLDSRRSLPSTSIEGGNDNDTTNNQRLISTREAFGEELLRLGRENENIVVLDADVGNSTYVNKFGKEFPDRFFEMFIAEQNIVSAALGLAKLGFIPYLSTFAAFLTRAFDQVRMSQYSMMEGRKLKIWVENRRLKIDKNLSSTLHSQNSTLYPPSSTLNIIGSHAGVSIGPDGPSQMGLEDIAMMRAIHHSTVLYPSDAISTRALTKLMATNPGINYLRTTRGETPVVYDKKEEFHIGGCKVHYPMHKTCNMKHATSKQKMLHVTRYMLHAVIITAGITLHEALKAQKELAKKKIYTIVIDLYSIKPLDVKTLSDLAQKTNHIIVVEDHHEAGGVGEAVLSALHSTLYPLPSSFQFDHLCVRKLPRSGTPEELLRYEEIDVKAIIQAVTATQV